VAGALAAQGSISFGTWTLAIALLRLAAATVRSVLMLMAVCVAVVDEREHDHLDTLILAAVVMLTTSPWLLFDISFQLSFLALWGSISSFPTILGALSATSVQLGATTSEPDCSHAGGHSGDCAGR